MPPKRPDSAKSGATRQTFDSDHFNQSKFSQTFTSNTTFQLEKKDQFVKYVQKKNKDPRFKHYQQQKLPSIPQVKPQLEKLNSKPFSKRNSKKEKEQVNKKIEQNLLTKTEIKMQVRQPSTKKQNQSTKNDMGSSKTFAQKNKQKMNATIGGLTKIQNQSLQPKITQKSKINFSSFSVNVPGKSKKVEIRPKQSKQQQKVEIQKIQKKQEQKPKTNQKAQKTQQQIKREADLLQISRFIDEMQKKNVDTYPQNYERFVQNNQIRLIQNNSDLQKINIDDFLCQNQPNQMDYEKAKKRIQQNERIIQIGDLSQSRLTSANGDNSSIDLSKLIQEEDQSSSNQIFLSSISSKDLKQRNLFLTEVLKGKITKQQIENLEKMQKSTIKLMKLQEKQNNDDDEIQFTQINMLKKKSNRLVQRNIIQASGAIYRDCDYLSEQNKRRLQNLLAGVIETSPFQHNQMQMYRIRRIDQGIHMYRQFYQELQQNSQIISQQCLPKDPVLKKQAQKKILKQKIDNLNKRLIEVQNLLINQTKIKQVVQKYKTTRVSQMGKSLIIQKNIQFDEIQKKKQQIKQILQKTQKQKANLQKILNEMQADYNQYAIQSKKIQKMSLQQMKQLEQQQIQRQKIKIKQIEQSLKGLQNQSLSMQSHAIQMKQNLQILTEIENIKDNTLIYQNYRQGQTLESLNQIFSQKVKKQSQHKDQSKQDPASQKQNNKQNQIVF